MSPFVHEAGIANGNVSMADANANQKAGAVVRTMHATYNTINKYFTTYGLTNLMHVFTTYSTLIIHVSTTCSLKSEAMCHFLACMFSNQLTDQLVDSYLYNTG